MVVFVKRKGELINVSRIDGVRVGEHGEPGMNGEFFVEATVDGSAVRFSEGLLTKRNADKIIGRIESRLKDEAAAGGGTIDWAKVEHPGVVRRIR